MDKKPRDTLNDARKVRECSLPGHSRTIKFNSIAAFEAHFFAEHAFRCTVPLPYSAHATTISGRRHEEESARRCNKTFPSEHMLSLHVEECHSTLSLQRKERGEKIFACFEPLCDRYFATPKHRRHHLIAMHHYPSEFFFAVTNHGVGQLRDLYGDGASLVRKTWKTRIDNQNASSSDRSDNASQNRIGQDSHSNQDIGDRDEYTMPKELWRSTAKPEPKTAIAEPSSRTATLNNKRQLDSLTQDTCQDGGLDPDHSMEASLENALERMSVLSLVPRSLQKHR